MTHDEQRLFNERGERLDQYRRELTRKDESIREAARLIAHIAAGDNPTADMKRHAHAWLDVYAANL